MCRCSTRPKGGLGGISGNRRKKDEWTVEFYLGPPISKSITNNGVFVMSCRLECLTEWNCIARSRGSAWRRDGAARGRRQA
jgi:hypothetical protein